MLQFLVFSFLIFTFKFSFANDLVNETKPLLKNEIQRGVCWVGESRRIPDYSIPKAKEFGVEWLSITPFGWMKNHKTPEVHSGGYLWGETDEGLIVTTREAHKNGVKVLLKPHLWITQPIENGWRGEINFETEKDWQKWENSYKKFILHFAEIAEEEKIDILCIGTEFTNPAKVRPQFWRNLIKRIREIYSGELTYAANWYNEYEKVEFWDDLDFIGIQAYFPLSDKQNPSVQELNNGWQPHKKSIQQVAEKFGKKVLFTEIGYKSLKGATIEPWIWPEQLDNLTASDLDFSEQENAYEALFQTFGQEDWFGGFYIWKWYPSHKSISSSNVGFTPQNKPAENLLKKWYTK